MFNTYEWPGFRFVSNFNTADAVKTIKTTKTSAKNSFVLFPIQTNLHPVVELFGYIAWTRHGILRFAYRIKIETFLHTGLLGVQLIWNVGKETSSFDAETKTETPVLRVQYLGAQSFMKNQCSYNDGSISPTRSCLFSYFILSPCFSGPNTI